MKGVHKYCFVVRATNQSRLTPGAWTQGQAYAPPGRFRSSAGQPYQGCGSPWVFLSKKNTDHRQEARWRL